MRLAVRRRYRHLALAALLLPGGCGARGNPAIWYGMAVGTTPPAGIAVMQRPSDPGSFRFSPAGPWTRGNGYVDTDGHVRRLTFEEDRCDLDIVDDAPVDPDVHLPATCHVSASQFATNVADAMQVVRAKLGAPSEQSTRAGVMRYIWNFEPRGVGCSDRRKPPVVGNSLAAVELDVSPDTLLLDIVAVSRALAGRTSAAAVETPCPITR